MSKPQNPSDYKHYVLHPRFGRLPRITDAYPIEDEAFTIYFGWHSKKEDRVPGTAVEADTARQSFAVIAITHYFDLRRVCEDCGRPFLFFAEEQKHWYEELGFPLEANAVRCVPCRKSAQGIACIRARYEALYHVERTPLEDLEFVECLSALVEAGAVGPRAEEKLRALTRRLPRTESPESTQREKPRNDPASGDLQ